MKKVLSLLVLYVLISSASAGIGIAKDYLPDNTLIMNKGETYYYNVYLTNTDTNPISLKIAINGPPALVYEFENQKDVIDMPAKTYNKQVRVKLTTKDDAPMGEKYRVDMKVTTTGETGGMITVSNEIGEHFFIQIGSVLRTTTTLSGTCKDGFEMVNGQCQLKGSSSGGGFDIFSNPVAIGIGALVVIAVLIVVVISSNPAMKYRVKRKLRF
jgi:hypothetical protein